MFNASNNFSHLILLIIKYVTLVEFSFKSIKFALLFEMIVLCRLSLNSWVVILLIYFLILMIHISHQLINYLVVHFHLIILSYYSTSYIMVYFYFQPSLFFMIIR